MGAALDAAHADGLIHRDIKPENVLLTPDDFAYLVDFGIAHAWGDASVTSTGLIIGSCAYMAAERFAGGGQVGPAADIYSLTCLLYESLTGRAPFETGGDLRQLMSAHMFSPPPRPSIMRRGITRAFDDVVARGMAKKPSDRYASAGELAKATAAAAGQVVPSRPALPPPSPPSSTKQFSAIYENPSDTGYTPYPPPVGPPPAPQARTRRFSRTQVVLAAATVGLFAVAVVLASVLIFGGRDSGPTPQPTLAAPPAVTSTETVTSTTSEPSSTTSTTPSTTSSMSSAPLAGMTGMDGQGFVGHTTRCDPGASLAAAIQTALSMAVVCETSPGSYEYRGERLRDGANIQLANATPAGGGFDVTNPADGARYEVRPDRLRILSNGGVDSDEPTLQYGSR